MSEQVIFKWNGEWHTLYDHFTPDQVKELFGKPVTSKRNLGLWKNGHFENCNVGDYIVKRNKNYEVLNHAKTTV